jgi:hypothetical protein
MNTPDRPLVLLVTVDHASGAALARDLEPRSGVISVFSFEAALEVVQSIRLGAVFTEPALTQFEPSGLDLLRFAEWAQPQALRVLVAAEPPADALERAHVVIKTPWTKSELRLLDVLMHDPVERSLARLRARWSS